MSRAERARWIIFVLALLSLSGIGPVALAADDPALPAVSTGSPGKIDSGDRVDAPGKVDSGDNAWMLVSSALVLMMTGPGLALFYSGLVRKKNVLSVMMQCVFLMCLMSVIWALYGFSLSFGGNGAWIGDGSYLGMKGVSAVWQAGTPAKEGERPLMEDGKPVMEDGEPVTEKGRSVLPMQKASSVPLATQMIFQCMFFIITPALICGAFAERMRFSTMVVFMILWGTFIYCPLAHWVWGGGVLSYGSKHAGGIFCHGALDFAGGTVVHISSGVSALVCALLLGKRLGYGKTAMPPHNLTYTAIGAAMLWVGWFGFNAGSAGSAGPLASSAFMATHFSAAAGGLTWAGLEWYFRGKPSMLGACSGVVAGLVCITPASGYVTPLPALVMGALAACVCYAACTSIKTRFGYDDSLDAFGVHGVGGTIGALLTGVFATRAVGGVSSPNSANLLGLIEGGWVIKAQIVAVITTWILAAVGTYIILKILDATMGLRVSRDAEMEGLDVSQHDEEGYIFL